MGDDDRQRELPVGPPAGQQVYQGSVYADVQIQVTGPGFVFSFVEYHCPGLECKIPQQVCTKPFKEDQHGLKLQIFPGSRPLRPIL